MEETPHKASREIDRVIERLNTRWDLQLPHLHGAEADSAGNSTELIRKCSSRIRALCWKSNVDMDGILDDFDERAVRKQSNWKYKPSQELGTLPRLSVTKSFLRRDAASKAPLTPQNRLELVKILAELLEEEYKLATETDTYQRTSFTSESTISKNASFASSRSSATSSTSFATAPSNNGTSLNRTPNNMVKKSKKPESQPKKREAPAPTPATSKRSKTDVMKGQQLLSFSGPSTAPPPTPVGPIQDGSFETVPSDFTDVEFSEADEGGPSSHDTSMMSDFEGDRDARVTSSIHTAKAPPKELAEEPNKSFTRSIKDLFNTLSTDGPFRTVTRQLPATLPYWYTFELYRLSCHLDCPVGDLFNRLKHAYGVDVPSIDKFWQGASAISKDHSAKMPEKSALKSWTLQDNRYTDLATGRSIALSGRLDFSQKSDQFFDFKLNRIDDDKSCRFHRKFGGDRFLKLDIPAFAPSHPRGLPKSLKDQMTPEKINDDIFAWLSKFDLYIAGRIWRAFFVEAKDTTKKKRDEEGTRQWLYLFAIDGTDFCHIESGISSNPRGHKPMSIIDFFQWHLPIEANISSTDLKLFARMQLGLSKTKATITLEPYEFIPVDDIRPSSSTDQVDDIDEDTIMTDGCALISLPLAMAIWKQYNWESEDLPSAFQARIGGAKGLWVVDYDNKHPKASKRGYWIEIRPSQLKIKPHPRDRLDADEFQRTFEIVKTSKPCTPGHLNAQLITILENRGVPRAQIAALLRSELAQYYESLDEAIKDPIALRAWRQVQHSSRSSKSEMAWCAGMPDRREDELDLLTESGFRAQDCPYMIEECLWTLISLWLERYIEKMRIEVPRSTNIFCIPDPYGVLKKGEVQLNFSTSWKDAETGISEMYLPPGERVLVARNPAHLPSDMQAVTAAYYHELRHIKDTIIFPIHGPFPLAGMLSGGDYDGDTCTVIWDKRLTADFCNYPVPKLPSKDLCGVESHAARVSSHFSNGTPSPEDFNNYIYKCCSFNGMGSRMGEVTKFYEKFIYTNSQNMETPEGIQLSTLAGLLVDSKKQGDIYPTSVWSKFQKDVAKRYKVSFAKPAYQDDKAGTGKPTNVLDWLKFTIAINEKDRILKDYAGKWWSPGRWPVDKDLQRLYNDEYTKSEKPDPAWTSLSIKDRDVVEHERKALNAVLLDLRDQLNVFEKEWKTWMKNQEILRRRRSRGETVVLLDYSKFLNEMAERIDMMEPLDRDCSVRKEYLRDGGGKGTRWSLLKASCAYNMNRGSAMPWKLFGDELCRIKARSTGPTWEMTRAMRDFMKLDTKKQRLFAANNEDEDDEFEDANE